MAWSFRKSFNSGPFRFTLSKSGVSSSVGFKGLRVGANSRGSWISVGAAGLRYRHFTPHARAQHQGSGGRPQQEAFYDIPAGSHGPIEQLQKAGIFELSDTDSQAVLAELNAKRKSVMSDGVFGCSTAVLLTLGLLFFPVNLLAFAGLIWWKSIAKKKATLTLLYDLDEQATANWEALRAGLLSLKSAQRLWHVHAKANVHDKRYHAGASTLLDRGDARVGEGMPELVESNVVPVSVQAGKYTLFFFPERVLLYHAKNIGAVQYASLQCKASLTTFIEDVAPRDAKVTGYTWQYVNRNGTPDRRFANNRQLPICEYDLLEIRSKTGLNQQFQLSRTGIAKPVAAVLNELAKLAPAEQAAARSTAAVAGEPPSLTPALPSPQRRTGIQDLGELGLVASPQVSPEPSGKTSLQQPAAVKVPERQRIRPPSVSATALHWVEAGQTAELGDMRLPLGMFYWSEGLADLGEPSTLALKQPVALPAAAMSADMGYWPSYGGMEPKQRRAYLEWLARGRCDAEPGLRSLSYVFLFFYGLERRMLVDGDRNPELLHEVSRLIQHYVPQERTNSLLSYGLQLLHFAGWQMGGEDYRAWWPHLVELDRGRTDQDALRLITAQLCGSGEPLHWSMAWRIAQEDEMSRTSVIIKRTGEKFHELFRRRYEERYGGGMILTAAKNPARIEYRPASMGLIQMKDQPKNRHLFELKVPNTFGLRRQFKPLPEIWNSCVDDLSGYSRTLVSKKATAFTAWQALPDELRVAQENPLQEALAEAVEESGFKILPVGLLASSLGVAERPKLTMEQSKSLVEALAKSRYNVAPNPELTLIPYRWDQPLALYPREPGDDVLEPQIGGLVRFLYLAVAVAAADGVLEDEELQTFNQYIKNEIFREQDWRHIRSAEAALRRDTHAAVRALPQIAAHISVRARQPVLRTLLHLSAADGEVSLDEQRMLRKIARIFGLEEEWIDVLLQEYGEAEEVSVVGGKPSGVKGETIPAKAGAAPSGFVLDMARVNELTQETHEVVALLNEVMNDDEAAAVAEEEMAAIAVQNHQIAPAWFEGLAQRYQPALLFLMEHDELTTEQFDILAKEHHLLPDDLLNSINAWADDTLGDFLIERGENVQIFRDLLPQGWAS